MFGHPGKKLLFMGAEFAQEREWNHDGELDWHLLQQADHAGVQRLVRDLNRLYAGHPALHARDCDADGFEWIRHDDTGRCTLAFVRRAPGQSPWLVLCNLTPTVHRTHRVGVPQAGEWVERLNTDSAHYGGSNVGTPLGRAHSEAVPCDGRAESIVVDLPPLATVFLQCQ